MDPTPFTSFQSAPPPPEIHTVNPIISYGIVGLFFFAAFFLPIPLFILNLIYRKKPSGKIVHLVCSVLLGAGFFYFDIANMYYIFVTNCGGNSCGIGTIMYFIPAIVYLILFPISLFIRPPKPLQNIPQSNNGPVPYSQP